MKGLLLLSLLLCAGSIGVFSDTMFISPASLNVAPGQTFAVDINIDNIPDLYDYQFSLSFDPAVLAAQSITEGALFANTNDSFFIPGTINNGSGTISLTADTLLGSVPGVAGPGTIAVVDFTALGDGSSPIEFSPASDLILQDSLGNTLTVMPVPGSVVVSTAVTPEPSTLWLLSAAIVLMIFGSWKRIPKARKQRLQ